MCGEQAVEVGEGVEEGGVGGGSGGRERFGEDGGGEGGARGGVWVGRGPWECHCCGDLCVWIIGLGIVLGD